MAILTVVIPLLVVAAFVIGVVAAFRRTVLRQARRAGYASAGDYLRAVPRSDEERRSAVDLALWGAVLCLLGILAPPLLLFGVFPLFYGVRKLAYASMGLGLVDDADQPGA